MRAATLAIYRFAADYAAQRGILIADTKFEFGTDADGKLYVMDEMLTPDSSRFWPADQYRVGISPPSYDKQFVRDYLETLDWNKQAPGPILPRADHRRHRGEIRRGAAAPGRHRHRPGNSATGVILAGRRRSAAAPPDLGPRPGVLRSRS